MSNKGLIAALALVLIGCPPLEEDCPTCEQQCWEGRRQCDECYEFNGCNDEGVD